MQVIFHLPYTSFLPRTWSSASCLPFHCLSSYTYSHLLPCSLTHLDPPHLVYLLIAKAHIPVPCVSNLVFCILFTSSMFRFLYPYHIHVNHLPPSTLKYLGPVYPFTVNVFMPILYSMYHVSLPLGPSLPGFPYASNK